MADHNNGATDLAPSILWRLNNPERAKEISKRYLERNKELIQLRRQRNWLFTKKGRGFEVSKEIAELDSKISKLIEERNLKND